MRNKQNYAIDQWEDEDELEMRINEFKDSHANYDHASAVSKYHDSAWETDGVDKELDKYLQQKKL